jgi:outer membrane protein assembly factor BamB
MKSPKTSVDRATVNKSPPPGCARRKWFPTVVIAAAVIWWIQRALEVRYTTMSHWLVIVGSAALISGWYLVYGSYSLRVRTMVFSTCWTIALASLAMYRPVYNGEMGIHRWRLRFAAAQDQSLRPVLSGGEIASWQTTPHDYAGFLGNGHWPEVHGVQLERDWRSHPPGLVWRHEIGAGWSAFSIVGNQAITQEQRGDQELVTCYRLDSGEPVWNHADTLRFDPGDLQGSVGGVGPRATPTIDGGKVFTQGATGLVNCLDARTGRVIWSQDTIAETGADLATWGKSGSPLIADGMVLVSVGAPADRGVRDKFNSSLVAYDEMTGKVRWAAGNRRASYASPMITTLASIRQVVMINEGYVTAHRLSDGEILWERSWAVEGDTIESAVQPIPLAGDRVLLCKGYGYGVSLLQVARDAKGKFTAQPVWNPPIIPVMKSKFSNLVVRDGFAYGLDEVLLECIELATGHVAWKQRHHPEFGHGQMMLIGDVMLVSSETGWLTMVEVSPQSYHELASILELDPADVTWNNPAFSAPYWLVRNAREAACYRLPIVSELNVARTESENVTR